MRDNRLRSDVRVGTAGWSIPAQHRDAFDDGASVLARYATRLDAVEINSSFYRPHQRKTYERWAASVPENFLFSVKLPRVVTHEHALRGAAAPLHRFVDECTGLGGKLGVVLVQLPPGLAFDGRVAAPFFAMLRRRLPAGVHIVCEPRHASWLHASASRILTAHGVNRVGADPSPIAADASPSDFGTCRYWRLHGSPKIYYSPYAREAFAVFAAQARCASALAPAWVVFDNTALGHAVADALRFRGLLARGD